MKSRGAGRSALIAGALTSTLVLAACGSTADTGAGAPAAGGPAAAGGVATDVGVTDTTITLGIMGDTSGVFKNLGAALNAGNEQWAADVNEAGGICGRQVEIEVVDHGYKADTAKTLYPQLEPQVLGMVQLLGSPVLAALEPNLVEDDMLAAPASWSSEVLDNPGVMMIGTTYDLEIVNGLAYLQQEGLIADGDTIGHIYIDGEYGGNGLKGSQYYAQQHNLTINEAKVTSTDNDLTGIVTGMRGAGVKAIVLTTTPGQTASALAANQALGLNVPVLGNNPSIMMIGTTYDLEIVNGLAYLQQQGLLADGDTIGHIYIDGEYGGNGLKGSKYYAEQHGLTVKEAKITSTDNDLTGIVTGLRGEGVKVLVLTTTPSQSASALAANQALGLNVPVLGNNPTFDPAAEGGLTEVAPLFTSTEAEGYKIGRASCRERV